MAKRGRPRKGAVQVVRVRDTRVGLYVMPDQRARLNWLAAQLGAESQNDALATALDAAGVPVVVAPEQPEQAQA